jgi:hypothetical protein
VGSGTPWHRRRIGELPTKDRWCQYVVRYCAVIRTCVVMARGSVHRKGNCAVIILGVLLLLVGWLTGLSILYTVGAIVLIIGVVFFILGNVGRPVGGRKVWF